MSRMPVEQRRATLIQAAYQVIADYGVEGATTRRICAQADMPLASFHYAFDNRIALLGAVMETAIPSTLNQMLDTILPAGEPSEGTSTRVLRTIIKAYFEAFYGLLQADPGRIQAILSLSLYAHNHEELQKSGRQTFEQLYDSAASALEVAARRASAHWSVPVSELGPIVIAACLAISHIYFSSADDAIIVTVIEGAVTALEPFMAEGAAEGGGSPTMGSG